MSRVDKRTGQAVAIKLIDIENAEDEVEDIIQEIAILSELQSPYVTKYYGSYAKGAELWIVMEFCAGGSCADLMKPGLIGEDYIAIILRELLLGLDYLHSDKKLHRDIKGITRPHIFPFWHDTVEMVSDMETDILQPPMFYWGLGDRSSWPISGCLVNYLPP